jgi:hypothetical protein
MPRLLLLNLFAFTIAGLAAPIPPPQVPDNLKVPAGQEVLLKALGKGSQVYVCKATSGDANRFEWVLARPDAGLFDESGARIGKHFAGPTWEASDGSRVTGQMQQRANAPSASAVPWLLLKAASNQGAGTFARVTYIQRVDTVGGLAPADGCAKSRAGSETPVDYQASYYFYVQR